MANTRLTSAQKVTIEIALNKLKEVLDEQQVTLVIDREDGVFRAIPKQFYLDPLDEHADTEVQFDKHEFSEIDTPIDVYDDYYHGIYPR